MALREGLRSILLAHHGDEIDPAELGQLNNLAATIPLTAGFGADGSLVVVPTTAGIDGALGRILAAAFTGVAERTWQRLKVCKMDTCRWAFFDASKNQFDEVFLTRYLKAERSGRKLRYVALIENGTAKVELVEVDESDPLFALAGSENCLILTTEFYMQYPMVIKGPGAGVNVTAAGLLADTVKIAEEIRI